MTIPRSSHNVQDPGRGDHISWTSAAVECLREGAAGRGITGARRRGVGAGTRGRAPSESAVQMAPPAVFAASMAPDFAPVRIIAERAAPGLPAPAGVIEIEFTEETRLRITGAVDAATVSAALGALAAKEGGHDRASGRRPGVAGNGPYRHEVGLRWPGPSGAGAAEARPAQADSVRKLRDSLTISCPSWFRRCGLSW